MMNPRPPPCPCGLTQEKLDEKGWVDNNQECTARYRDAHGVVQICGQLYTDHPYAPPVTRNAPILKNVDLGMDKLALVWTIVGAFLILLAIHFSFNNNSSLLDVFRESNKYALAGTTIAFYVSVIWWIGKKAGTWWTSAKEENAL